MKPARWRADLALIGVAFIWGATFVLVKSALNDVSAILFLTFRFAVAAVALLPILAWRKAGRLPSLWRGGVLTGIALFAGYALQTAGLHHTTPTKSGFITGLYVVLVPMLAAVVHQKVPVIAEWVGVGIATTGLFLLSVPAERWDIGLGEALTIGCAVAFAIHIVVLGYYAERMKYEWLAFLQLATCAVAGAGTFWWMERPYLRWSGPVVVALVVTSLLATAVAFLVQTWAQQHTTPTRAALIFALEPVFAFLTSYVVAGEQLSGRALLGAVCILAGIVLVELKPVRARQHPHS